MLGLKVLKVRLAALFSGTAVKKSAEELKENRTKSNALHLGGFLAVTPSHAFSYNGDVATIVDNYPTGAAHLPDNYQPFPFEKNSVVWFEHASLTPLTTLLKSKRVEDQMLDASVTRNDSTNRNCLIAFNSRQTIPAPEIEAPKNFNPEVVIQRLKNEKEEATTIFSLNIRDLGRVCDYLKKVGDDNVEVRITNQGQSIVFESKVLHEAAPHVECHLRIQWGKLFKRT